MKTYAAQAGPLWAVTSYFNPVGYRRRRENYRVFRAHLKLPLVAVELSFNGHFELQPEDAEILIQIQGRDVMWQKERLLNVAIAALPARCTQVAILDCDVVFCRPDWTHALSRRLQEFPLVQPFSTVHYPPADASLDDPATLRGAYTRPSLALLIEHGAAGAQCIEFKGRGPGTRSTGHALAARRELLQAHGLHDVNIIGGGDAALMAAAFGVYEQVLGYQSFTRHHLAHYRAWGEPFYRDVQGAMGCVNGDLLHLWHGDINDRGSVVRHRGFAAFDYDPATDIALEESGCWRWNSDKPAMHAYLRDYFPSRKEDGRAIADADATLPVASTWQAAPLASGAIA